MNTLFPSPKTEQGIKGGVVLLRMAPPPAGAHVPLQLAVTYTDRAGKGFRWAPALPCTALAVAGCVPLTHPVRVCMPTQFHCQH